MRSRSFSQTCSSHCFVNLCCPFRGKVCCSSLDSFFWAAFLSISLLASVFLPLFFLFLRPAWFMREFLTGVGLLCMDTLSCIHGHTFLHSWTHFLASMEWADDIGSRLATWSYFPVQSSSCSLLVLCMSISVEKDTYKLNHEHN